MSGWVAACCVGIAFWILRSRDSPARRVAGVVASRRSTPDSLAINAGKMDDPATTVDRRIVLAACLAAAFGLWLLIGGPLGVVLGAVAVVIGPRILAGIEPRGVRLKREALEAAAPMVADLMGACLASGASSAAATQAVAAALDGPASELLGTCVAHIALGGDPTQTWSALSRGTAFAPIARAVSRSAESGAPLSEVLLRVADELRASRKATLETAARSAGIKAVGPLGLCFLPAFMLIGIVPLVASLIVSMTA